MPRGTPNAARLEAWVESEYPGIFRFGRCNCRKIGGSTRWSQHAECNARDIHQRDGARHPNAPHLANLAGRLLAMKGTFDEYGWGIYHILWAGRSLTTGNPVSDHYDHIHVDFYPMMKNNGSYKPPCKGGSLVVIYPDGTRDDEWKLWPEDTGWTPPPSGGDEDMEQMVKDIQANLNAAGFTDQNGQPLVVDGVWGAKTKFAHMQMCIAAGAVEQEVKKVIDVLNVVVEGDQLTLEITPPAGYSTADVVKVEK